jgi:hypothetical protein
MRLKSSKTNDKPIPSIIIISDDAKIIVEILSIMHSIKNKDPNILNKIEYSKWN